MTDGEKLALAENLLAEWQRAQAELAAERARADALAKLLAAAFPYLPKDIQSRTDELGAGIYAALAAHRKARENNDGQ